MPDMGSWPDWIAAGAGVLAFIIAAVAAWATVKTNRAQQEALAMQQKQIDQQREEKIEDQAKRVSWTINEDNNVLVFNNSDRPITDIWLHDKVPDQWVMSAGGNFTYVAAYLKPNCECSVPWSFRSDGRLYITFKDADSEGWAMSFNCKPVNRKELTRALGAVRVTHKNIEELEALSRLTSKQRKHLRKYKSQAPQVDYHAWRLMAEMGIIVD